MLLHTYHAITYKFCIAIDESLLTYKCLKAMVGGKQGYAPYKIPFIQQSTILYQSHVMKIVTLLQR